MCLTTHGYITYWKCLSPEVSRLYVLGIEAAALCLHVCESGVVIGVDVGHVNLAR